MNSTELPVAPIHQPDPTRHFKQDTHALAATGVEHDGQINRVPVQVLQKSRRIPDPDGHSSEGLLRLYELEKRRDQHGRKTLHGTDAPSCAPAPATGPDLAPLSTA